MSESVGRLIVDLLRRPWTDIGATHYLDEYLRSQWLSSSALHSLQMAKLRHLVWHCVLEVPELRAPISAALSPSAIEKLDDVTKLPIATAAVPRSERDNKEADARRAAIRARSEAWGAPEEKWWMIPTRGVLAAPCRESGDAFHIHADHLIVECVPENGDPAKPGEQGRLLLTDLHDLAEPLLRSDLLVRGRMPSNPCACGRMLPLVELAGPKGA